MRRVYYTVEPPQDLAIVTDASPWGAGGVLVHVATGKPLEGFVAVLTADDEAELGVKIGSPDGQALLELWAIFLALKLWVRMFRSRLRKPVLRADSLAALGAAKKLSSPTPGLNHMGAEMSILLEVWDVDEPVGRHLPGKLNDLADYYSRLQAPNCPAEPAAAKGLKVRTVVRARGRGFVLPSAGLDPPL